MLAALFIMVLTLAMVGALFWAVVWLGFIAPRRDTTRWLAAAQQLGLEVEPYDPSRHRENLFGGGPTFRQAMHGTRAGIPVTVGIRVEIRGAGKNRRRIYFTYAQAYFPSSLGLGISVRPVDLVSEIFQSLAGQSDLQVGIADLDRLYDIRAVDSQATLRVVGTPYVGEALLGLAPRAFKPQISDTVARCETQGRVTDAAQLAVALDSAVELARRVVAARSAVTADLDRALAAWRSMAINHNFEFDGARAWMGGRVEGIAVEARVETRENGRFTVYSARFDRPLGVGLQLTRQGSLTKIASLLGFQDIAVGDPVFDARFVVKGKPEDRVRALLTPEVRAQLVAIQEQATQLSVGDEGLTAEVAWLVADPQWVEAALHAMARAAAALTNVHMPSEGPFRG